MLDGRRLSIGSLVRVFRRQVAVTWGLTLLETALVAALPLLIGFSIDGLLQSDPAPFSWLAAAMGALLILVIGRRVYDTRAYGSMRVELGHVLVERSAGKTVSAVNARLDMSRELVGFLEEEAPVAIAAVVQVVVAIAILWSFHGVLALAATGATVATLLIYGLSGDRFFALNRALNRQVERQVTVLGHTDRGAIRRHLSALRRHEIRISDTEALVYGLILALLLAMLGFNLWFAATQTAASPGRIFSIVAYSYEFLDAAVVIPAAMQSLTRIAEITGRINGPSEDAVAKPQTAQEA